MLLLLIVILQQPFQIRSLIKYLPCKLRVGDNPPIPIVLQGSGADIQPLAYFFTCEEMFSTKQRFVCLCHFLNSLAYSADSGQHLLHIVSLHVQISYLFHSSCLICCSWICLCLISRIWFPIIGPHPHACNSTYARFARKAAHPCPDSAAMCAC